MMEQILYPVIVWVVCGVAWYAVGNAAAAIATDDAATAQAASAKTDAAQVRTYKPLALAVVSVKPLAAHEAAVSRKNKVERVLYML